VSWWTAPAIAPGPTFDIDGGSIPAEIFGLESYASPIAPAPRVSRREAIQVPAVKRGRDLIAGTIGTVPFRLLDTDNEAHPSNLLDQPERHRARSVTMAQTVEDMLFEGKCWWWITEYDYRPYPTKIVKLDPNVQPDERGHIKLTLPGGRVVDIPPRDQILFEAPSDGILSAGARAIRTWLKLAGAVDKYADEPTPAGYFTPKPEADPDEADVEVFLADWAKARRTRTTGYVPAVVDYNTVQWNPEQLQLIEGRKQAVVEIAEVLGVDPEDLGVSTTSRTYQNGQQRKLDRINDTLGMYVSAIQERLSMPDVTPRGYRVLADFNGFLRADDKTRFETYDLGVKLGIYDRKAIADREDLPEPTFPMPAPAAIKDRGVRRAEIEATTDHAARFDGDDPSTFGFYLDPALNTFEVDPSHRTIAGIAVPWGKSALRNGRRWQFSKGSLTWSDPSRIKLLIQHDRSQAVGKAIELTDTDHGLFARFKIARTPEGDRALALAEDGVYDGLSIGLSNDATFDQRDGINHSRAGNQLTEISLTPSPAFDDARVSAVVAEADERNPTMECQICGSHDHIASACPRFTAAQAPQFEVTPEVVAALGAHFQPAQPPPGGGGRETVEQPQGPLGGTGGTGVEVNEPAPYRFDRSGTLTHGSHDFARDLRAAHLGDRAAHDRALGFIQAHAFDAPNPEFPQGPAALQFAVQTGDVAALNPNVQRPDLYVDQRRFTYPLWEAVRKGTLDEITPMVVPKWSSHSGLVAAHVQDTEPGEGTFVATSETVTPAAVSGKVRITREVWDQGGPAASALIWQKMVQGYNEALEATVVTELEAESPGGTITLTVGGAGNVLSADLAAAFADLQFVRGGFDFSVFAGQQDLYKRLATAVDTTNRPLFPMLGPTNANGQVVARFSRMNVHGVDVFPEWGLLAGGQTTPVNSYLLDPASVFAVASAPQRLEFQYQVRSVELAIWGYRVVEVTDNPGIRRVVWDPLV